MDRKLNNIEGGRKRGRPAGKNRLPLSLEERRARNAQYERERRIEMTDALTELAEAAGCDSSMSSADLLATVINLLANASQRKHSSDADSLRRCNKNLMAQIADLEQRLGSDPDNGTAIHPPQTEEIVERPRQGKRKRDNFEAQETEYTRRPTHFLQDHNYCLQQSSSTGQKYWHNRRPSTAQGYSPEQNFEPEPEYTPKYETEPVEQHLPTGQSTMTRQLSLPVPEVSPPSDSSGPLSCGQGTVDYSSYQFAGAQVPTPEYRILPDAPEYILPELDCSPQQDVCNGQQDFWRSGCSGETSAEQYVPAFMPPSRLVAAEPHNPDPYICQPLAVIQPPIQQDIASILGTLPIPEDGEATMPNINDVTSLGELDFLSTEDLISVYL